MVGVGSGVGNPTGRLKRLIFNLFYPAVLGTFFVSLLPAGVESLRRGLDLSTGVDWKLLTSLLIVAHFVVDYIFTEEVRLYKTGMFTLDFVVIFLLYTAYSSVHLGASAIMSIRTIACSMSGVYFCFLLWEYLERREIGRQPVMTAYEAFFAIWFLMVGFLWQSAIVLGVSMLSATAMMIVICGNVLRGYHAGQSNMAGAGS
jgi:hypothetical protein